MQTTNPASGLELLQPLFMAATNEASAAMCIWTSGMITLSLNEVHELPLEAVCDEFNIGDELLTMVVLSIEGPLAGEMILTFDEENGRQLAATLLRQKISAEDEWSELEKSALAETGNILGCAYLNALNRLIKAELIPSPPYFIQDYGASVLQQAMIPQAMLSNQVLVCRTCFHRNGEALDWSVFFVPTQPLRERIERSLHRRLAT